MPNYSTTYYDEVGKIPDTVFKDLSCDHSFFFERDFLSAFAMANPAIKHHYLIISAFKKPLALAIVQQVAVVLDSTPEKVSTQNKIARLFAWYFTNNKVNIALCGNLFLSGNYGIVIKEGAQHSLLYEHIALEMKSLQTQKEASLFFIKDFNNEVLSHLSKVSDHQFEPFQVEPNMQLKLVWESFKDYKNAMRSKYRVKINKADEKSSALTVKLFEASDIKTHKTRLQELYGNITDRAIFKAVVMNVETYALLKERFRESVTFTTYWHQEVLVGFATAFHVHKQLHAHYVGIAYAYNKGFSIYPRILNDYVRLGLELKCDTVNFGRTASEIKSTLGALPENLSCYVRHRTTIANLFLKPLVRQLKMTPYKQHDPFKRHKAV